MIAYFVIKCHLYPVQPGRPGADAEEARDDADTEFAAAAPTAREDADRPLCGGERRAAREEYQAVVCDGL